MGRLEGKSVVITGAGSGIGRAASVLFSREGAKLIIVDRAEGVKETAKLVSDAGGTVEAVMADAGSESDVKAFIDKAVRNTAGSMRSGPMPASAAGWCRWPSRPSTTGRKSCAST